LSGLCFGQGFLTKSLFNGFMYSLAEVEVNLEAQKHRCCVGVGYGSG
jgi:hypothetical protein